MQIGHESGSDGRSGMDDQTDVPSLRHPGDVASHPDAPDMGRIRLDVVESLEIQEAPELVQAGQALAAGDRHSGRAPQRRIALRVVVPEWLLHEQEIERFEGAGQVERRRARPWFADLDGVAVSGQLHVRPERLAQRPELRALVGDASGGTARVPGPVRWRARSRDVATGSTIEAGPDLQPAEAERAVAARLLHRPLQRPRPRAARRVERKPVVGRSAQQFVNGSVQCLAGDVPEGHLQPREHGQPDPDTRPPQGALVELAEGRLGLAGVEIEPGRQAAVIVDEWADDLGTEVAHDRLTDTGDPFVSLHDDECRSPLETLAGKPERVPCPGRRDQDGPDAGHPHALDLSRSRRRRDRAARRRYPRSRTSLHPRQGRCAGRREPARRRPRHPGPSPT